MDIIFTLLALFPSLLQAGAQGGSTSSASIDNSEIKQILIKDDYSLKFNGNMEFTKEIIGLV
ncbi:hypothetical protein [Winogradskyella flava]|uniref:hypothetical protein n=1 Tax=Winogradskyella flava TaxID=1884876 RepID=UPI002490D389|nr:hypothetical protein [Winogradskyella flava]